MSFCIFVYKNDIIKIKIIIDIHTEDFMKKQAYLPIVLVIFYVISIMAIMALLDEKNLQIKLIFLATSLALISFSSLLKLTNRIYWLTSYDYEDYKKMPVTERMDISSKYSKLIAYINGVLCIYLLISIYFNINVFVDVILFIISILLMCFTNINKIK